MQRKLFYYTSAIIITAMAYSCSNNSATDKTETKMSKADSAKAAEEAKTKPNSDYKPAFKGQTRITAVKTTTPYKVEKIAEHLGRPWAVVPLPDGNLILT